MLDFGFIGSRFTWNRGNLFERLDKALCNKAWRVKFEEATVFHLSYFVSDHKPILIKLTSFQVERSNTCPFRFLSDWLIHLDFKGFVKANCRNKGNIVSIVSDFVALLKRWNKEVFGYITHKKNNLLTLLNGI